MANINLISTRRAERLKLARIARGLMVGVAASVLLGLGGIVVSTGQLLMAAGRVAALDRELEVLRPILRRIELAEQERSALRPRLATLTEAQTQTRHWFGIMEGLKRAVPEQTWLTNLAVEQGADNAPVIRINGVAVNQSRVGETMYRLTLQPEFYRKVDLRYTQTARVQERESVEFELAAHLHETGEKKSEEGKAENATQAQ